MLKISTAPREPDEFDEFATDCLVVNGERLADTVVYRADKPDKLNARVRERESMRKLACYSLKELGKNFVSLRFALEPPIENLDFQASFVFSRSTSRAAGLYLKYSILVEEWTGPWSITEYDQAIRENMQGIAESGGTMLFTGLGWEFYWPFTDRKRTADVALDYWVDIASTAFGRAREKLVTRNERDTLVTLFDFPKNVSTACEQYLLYFVQFLRDLGIEAGASIKHEAHHVLFSVTPEEGAEALDRIREALDIYLRLPDSPEFAATAPAYGDIAIQQLQANIHHLNGQLAIAGAVLEAKNARIEALQLANFTYQQLLATQQQLAAIPLLPPGQAKEDAESLVPGVIDVTRYEGKGFTVNFAEILRRLKRRFDQD